MRYWLMKSEPEEFSIDDLQRRPGQTEPWNGVRNFQARNLIRDVLCRGDQAFFYHSGCAVPGIAGIMSIASSARPDPTAFDPKSKYYDPKSKSHTPTWYLVDVKFQRRLQRLIPLAELKMHKPLRKMQLLQRGNRLSVMPVTRQEWEYILKLE
jgi:predicted RNA-binding protein with PUA-like domain